MASYFLTDADMTALTGKRQKAARIAVLNNMHIAFIPASDGSPLVPCSLIDSMVGIESAKLADQLSELQDDEGFNLA
jgi:hypothetical protein